MKTNIIIILFVILASCQKEPLVPCKCDGNHPGLVCREYYYEKGAYTTYIDYLYHDSSVPVKKSYYSINGHLNLYIILSYNEKLQLISQTFHKSNGERTSAKYYTYNEFDSIKKITCFNGSIESDNSMFLYNDANNVSKIVVSEKGNLLYFTEYEYDSEGFLWKKSRYNNDSVLTEYTIIKHFNNGIIRETFYNSKAEITAYRVMLYTDGRLHRINFYDKNLQITNWITYTYAGKQLEKISNYNYQGTLDSFTLYQYY